MQPRVVAITGGSSGIGRAAAIRFAREGWRVGLIARGEAALEAACKDVVEHGGTAAMATADVADPAQLEAAAASIEAALGPIEVWINNAGIGVWGWFEDVPEEQFRRVTEVNYLGTVNGTRVALRRMLPRDAGTIVQVLSVISHRGVPLQAAYSGAKYGLRGFSEAVRSELHAKRSRVYLTMVHPPIGQHAVLRPRRVPHGPGRAPAAAGLAAGGRRRRAVPRCNRQGAASTSWARRPSPWRSATRLPRPRWTCSPAGWAFRCSSEAAGAAAIRTATSSSRARLVASAARSAGWAG